MKNILSWLYPSILLLITLVVWFPTITLPYWWDSAGFVIQAARQFVATNFWPLVPGFTNFAHPPLFIFCLALLWKLFGESLIISHLLNLVFTFLLVLFTYLTGKTLIREKPLKLHIGLLVSLLVLFTPVVLAQVGIIYLEIPVTAFAVMSYYFYINKRYLAAMIAATCMVLTKEIAVVVVFIYLALTIAKGFRQHQPLKLILQKSIYFAVPVCVLLLWYVYHHAVKGWWLYVPGLLFVHIDLSHYLKTFQFIFIDQFRFLLVLLLLPLLVFLLKTQRYKAYIRLWTSDTLPLLFIPLTLAPLLGSAIFLQRYSILLFPFFYLFCLYNLVFILNLIHWKRTALWVGGCIILLAFVSQWDTHRAIATFYFSPLEDNLEYRNIIHLGQETAGYLEQRYPNAIVYTSFPLNYMLSWPFEHYVTKPIRTVECLQYKKGDRVDFIILHLYSPGEVACFELARALHLKTLKVFEENGKFVVLMRKQT